MNKALIDEARLRIALLGYRSHPHVGGQGIYLHYLSKALTELGHEVVVFSGPPYPELDSRVCLVKVPSLDLYSHPSPFRALKWKNLGSFTDIYEWLSKLSGGFAEPYIFGRRLYSQHSEQLRSFDIVHDNQSLCPALLKLQSSGIKVTATIHHPIQVDRDLAVASVHSKFHGLLIRRWYRFIKMQEQVASKLNSLVTVSKQSRKDIEKNFLIPQTKISVIPNGIDTDIFRPLEKVRQNPWRLITTASSDQTMKGLHILFQAFSQIHQNEPRAELVVVGKLKKNSEAATVFSSLSEHTRKKIHFTSRLETSELVEHYASSAIAICPSLYEGFGLPALEAMACGLALISSNGGALPEVIGDAGLLVDAGSSEQLAMGCLALLQNPEKQKEMSTKALNRVKAHYSWSLIAKKYVNFYHSQLVENVNT